MKFSSKRWVIFFVGFLTGMCFLVLVAMLILASGVIHMGASKKPGWLEKNLAGWALDRSMERRAPEQENPFAEDAQALAVGLEHYRAMCLLCHGAPGVQSSELADGLNPPAPSLETEIDEFSDGELFWIVKNGIRMTGMPGFGSTHNDDAIWNITAFVRHLPGLTAEEKASLQSSSTEEEHAGDHQHSAQTIAEESAEPDHDHGQTSQPAAERIEAPATLPHEPSLEEEPHTHEH